jgi:hypothetical protein
MKPEEHVSWTLVTHASCSQCGQVNRIPPICERKGGKVVRCGSCHHEFTSMEIIMSYVDYAANQATAH